MSYFSSILFCVYLLIFVLFFCTSFICLPLCLCAYIQRIDYDALVRGVEGPARTLTDEEYLEDRVFSVTDDEAYSGSKSLAAELRAKTKYVDLSVFSLKCLICGQGLTGQKDASKVSRS